MKKIILISLALIAITLSGCSASQSTPEKLANSFFKSAQKFDLNKSYGMISKNEENDQMIEILTSNYSSKDTNTAKEFIEVLKYNSSRMSYKVLDVKEEDDKATVKVKVKYIDSSKAFVDMMNVLFNETSKEGFFEKGMSEEDSIAKMNKVMGESFGKSDKIFVNKEIELKMVKIDNKWYLEDITREIMDIMTCNIYSITYEMNEAPVNQEVKEEVK